MKYVAFLFGFLSLAPMLAAGPGPCVRGTLASDIALGVSGFAVGNILFVDFGYSSKTGGGAPKIPPDLIQVNLVMFIPEAAFICVFSQLASSRRQTQE